MELEVDKLNFDVFTKKEELFYNILLYSVIIFQPAYQEQLTITIKCRLQHSTYTFILNFQVKNGSTAYL